MIDDIFKVFGSYVLKRIAAILFIGAAYLVTMNVFMRIDLEKQQEQEKKAVLEHLQKDYPFGSKVQIKRGRYSGHVGHVLAYEQFIYILLVDLKNLERVHLELHAQDFDDATMNYMNKFLK